MIRTVQTLRLSGLDAGEALQSVAQLLADRAVLDLTSLLVLDDTATLLEHAGAFESLLTSGRLHYVLCVAIGPPADDHRPIAVPGSIGSGQGSALLWVSDPLGVDWELSASAAAIIHPLGPKSGLDRLVEVLSAIEVFDRARELVVNMPEGIASPGLRIAGENEDMASFPVALAATIQRIIRPLTGSGQPEPLIPVSGRDAGGARVAEDGQVRLDRDRCTAAADELSQALDELATSGGLRAGPATAAVRDRAISTGQALHGYRERVRKLLEDAHAPGGLTDQQRQRLREAGIEPPVPRDQAAPMEHSPAQERGVVAKAVAERIRAGDSLIPVTERLAVAERRLSPKGSRAYLPVLEQCCPLALVQRLREPPPMPGPPPWLSVTAALTGFLSSLFGLIGIATGLIAVLASTAILVRTAGGPAGDTQSRARRAMTAHLGAGVIGVAAGAVAGIAVKPPVPVAGACFAVAVLIAVAAAVSSWRRRVTQWRHMLSPSGATSAAQGVWELMAMVAAAEWSADTELLETVARTKISLQGVSDQLREYADGFTQARSLPVQESQLSRSLAPTLRQLVLAVLAAEPAKGRYDGQVGYRQAKETTGKLIDTWIAMANEHGPLSWPPFAGPDDQGIVDASGEELQAIAAAATYDPCDAMWQLCAPSDLPKLDTAASPHTVAFAPRVAQSQLIPMLPADIAWTSSSLSAGLLRLVPLRSGAVELIWAVEARGEA